VDGNPASVLARLTRDLGAGDILLLHDRAPSGRQAHVATDILPALLERIAATGLKAVPLRAACEET
jgi:hypothetical protein